MHAGIAGGGIVGRVLAWQLLQRGWQVSLFDQQKSQLQGGCSFAAAGMLSPFVEVETASPLLYQMGLDSIALWAQWLQHLSKPVLFKTNGSILLSHRKDQAELERLLGVLTRQLPEQSLAKSSSLISLDRQQLSQLEPELASLTMQSYFLKQEGQIDTLAILQALYDAIIAQGGHWLAGQQVKQLQAGCVITAEQQYQFDWVFDCRGLGARNDLPQLRGQRGELIVVHAPDVNISRPVRLMHPRYRLYIVPRPEHIYYIGASEIEAEDYSAISVRSCLELLTAAYSVHPGFAEARIVRSQTHCRPTFTDNLPRLYMGPRLIGINGLFRNGYLLSPILVEQAIAIAEQGESACQYSQLIHHCYEENAYV